MQFTKKDFSEMDQVAELINFCDTSDNQTLEKVGDEMYQYQPFLISLFLGYKDDVDIDQMGEILHMLIIIWLFFRDKKNVKRSRIKAGMFAAKERKNVRFLKYLQGELSTRGKKQATATDLGTLRSKALFTSVLFRMRQGPTLKNLSEEKLAITLMGMKSLIECFEDITFGKKRRFGKK